MEQAVILNFTIYHQGVNHNFVEVLNEPLDLEVLFLWLIRLWPVFKHLEISFVKFLGDSLVVRHVLVNLHYHTLSTLRVVQVRWLVNSHVAGQLAFHEVHVALVLQIVAELVDHHLALMLVSILAVVAEWALNFLG